MGEEMADSILRTTYNFHGKCTDLLHAAKLRHGTDGFTSPPKEGMLGIFVARKIRPLQPGLNPRTWVPEASMLTTRPQKPLHTALQKCPIIGTFCVLTLAATWSLQQHTICPVSMTWVLKGMVDNG
jgi:hypothetical protein